MKTSLLFAFAQNFLGKAPPWYKWTLLAFLAANPIILLLAGPYIAGWVLVFEFIFTLAMALSCYPLQPGGLLALQAVILGLTTPEAVYRETEHNFAVILLLMFMVAGIYFMRDLLLFLFTRLMLNVRSKIGLAVLFCASSALLSAFLDALTVTAVIITVATGFFTIYHKAASDISDEAHDPSNDSRLREARRSDLESFRAYLRGLMMHGAVGTALGGVSTLVGEPQNLLIGETVGWNFMQFFVHVAPVSLPVFAAGLGTCMLLEKCRWFGYGGDMPDSVREALSRAAAERQSAQTPAERARLWAQGVVAALLVLGLALHVAEVGLIGLSIIVLATAFCGVIEEKKIGHAFEEALPFTALLVTFFAIVAVIHDQHLFKPVIDFVLAQEGRAQLGIMFLANGALSAISDNVFVATVYIGEVKAAFDAGLLTREQFELLAVAVNTGTNIPSVATPNGQAAFLFLLTSALAPLIQLGYGRMVWMALPYTVVLTLTGLAATVMMA